MPQLLCLNCWKAVVFGPDGWDHGEPDLHCPSLRIAWPPPLPQDD